MNIGLFELTSRSKRGRRNVSGQALVEMASVLLLLLVMVFGMIDFGRAITAKQIVVNLSREAANLASRGTTLTNTLTAVTGSGRPLAMNEHGYVILTVVTRHDSGQATIVDQLALGGDVTPSKIGSGVGSTAKLPNDQLPVTGQSLFVAEVFYRLAPITPIGKLLGVNAQRQMYDAAYF